jgi:7-carboxy-7-deazaguanine synthase
MDPNTLLVHEIFTSIQGESTFVGLPCVFVRLGGCNLRCSWCDTPGSWEGGRPLARAEVRSQALAPGIGLVELTGGEPLLQAGTVPLLRELCDAGRIVLLETNGSLDVSEVDPRVHKIIDLKTPSSGQHERVRFSNLRHLTARDELKFVLGDRADYEWMRQCIAERGLERLGAALLASCVWGRLDGRELCRWVLEDRLPVRIQVQLHKVLWGPNAGESH